MPKMYAVTVVQEVLAAAGCHLGSGHWVTAEISETTSSELLSKPQGVVQIQKDSSIQSRKGWLWLSLHYITFFLPFLSG